MTMVSIRWVLALGAFGALAACGGGADSDEESRDAQALAVSRASAYACGNFRAARDGDTAKIELVDGTVSTLRITGVKKFAGVSTYEVYQKIVTADSARTDLRSYLRFNDSKGIIYTYGAVADVWLTLFGVSTHARSTGVLDEPTSVNLGKLLPGQSTTVAARYGTTKTFATIDGEKQPTTTEPFTMPQQTITYLGRETIRIRAGRFETCKSRVRTTDAYGFATSRTVWELPGFGVPLKTSTSQAKRVWINGKRVTSN